MPHAGYVRNFEHLVRELSNRGWLIRIGFERRKPAWLDDFDPVATLAREGVAVEDVVLVQRRRVARAAATVIRQTFDYLRFLEPEFAEAPKLRARAARHVPRALRLMAAQPRGRRAVTRALRPLEAALRRKDVDSFVEHLRPDVLLVTPLVGFGSEQVDYVSAATSRGIPSALLVASWDNLTTKGLIREIPDLILVWNQAQVEEATQLHGVPAHVVAISGAHSWDHWFDLEPRSDRTDFCRGVGLRGDRPFVLYACSSSFVAPDEVAFVNRWIDALRANGLDDVGVLVRPHPQNAEQWSTSPLGHRAQVVVWPQEGASPVDERRRAEYFDSIRHAAAVVGANTSALIEAAIIGTPVLTILADEFRETQGGTLHFHHLVGADGLLEVAETFPEHAAQLREALADRESGAARRRAFLEAFIRPGGLARPAAPIAADAIEHLQRRHDSSSRPRKLGFRKT
jgi:hypothetical protein